MRRIIPLLFAASASIVFMTHCGGKDETSPVGSGEAGSSSQGSTGQTTGLEVTSGTSAGDSSGTETGESAGDGDTGTSGSCTEEAEVCETDGECCDTLRCVEDAAGTSRCTDEAVCLAFGASCQSAVECCSLSCFEGTCGASDAICSPAGLDCTEDAQCCSDRCDGTCQSLGDSCSTVGEVCQNEGRDSSCCSKVCENFGTDEEPDLRCGRSSMCGARGEVCSVGKDCCSGVCLDGRCPTQNQITGQLFAGEPCDQDADCASFACASSEPGAPKTCQFLGGCRPAGEICSDDWQCCSHLDISEGGGDMCLEENAKEGVGCEAHEIEGLSVCGLNTDPKEVGEVCQDTEGNKVHDCCPSENCEATTFGVWRCSGGEGFGSCRDDGESCQAAGQCCSNICAPVETDEGIVLRCGESCVETAGLCTTNGDCCGGVCDEGRCSPEVSSCVPLGAACESDGACCSGTCIDGTCQTLIIR